MSLLAETIVEEYYNSQGYFTIRGVRLGVQEMDILAINPSNKNNIKALHIEVQVSHSPVKYISNLPPALQKELHAKSKTSAVRRDEQHLKSCVDAWIQSKFKHKSKQQKRAQLCPEANWEFVFVHGKVKDGDERELKLIEQSGVILIGIDSIICDLIHANKNQSISAGIGGDIINLFKVYDFETKPLRLSTVDHSHL